LEAFFYEEALHTDAGPCFTCLAGVQEYLYQRSRELEKREKGLIGYNTVGEIPIILFFCWKYLPTIVMVSYGVLWQITDYEVKRLEAILPLSQPSVIRPHKA